MQLEDMKQAWADMNRKLEETEITNKKIISKMIMSNAHSGFEKLVRYEWTFLFAAIFAMFYFLVPFVSNIFGWPCTIIVEILMFYCALEQAIKIHMLKQIHLESDSVSVLMDKILAYKSFTMKMFKVGMYVLLPIILVTIFVSLWMQAQSQSVIYATLIGAFVGAILGLLLGLSAFKRHKKNIEEVIENLVELKDYMNQ